MLFRSGGAAPRLFSELTLLDAESPGRLHPLLPQRHLPLLTSLADDLASRKLGELLSIQFLRTQPGTTLDTATLDRSFLHDVDLLRCLLGRFEQLTAFRHADPSGRILQATTTLGGVHLPPVSWQVGPGIEAGWRLTVSGELGRMVVQANDRELTLERDGHPIESWPSLRAEAHAVRQSVADALTPPVAEGQSPGRRTTWDDLLRGVELLAATRESLRRRRTIDVLFEAPSERNLFKSHMTAAGCGLLLLTPVLVVLYLLVAAALPLPEWLKISLVTLVFAPFGLFLLFVPEPAGTRYGQMSAGRMSNHQVPAIAQNLPHIALKMLPATFAFEKIARPRIVPLGCKSIPYRARKLAGDKHLHGSTSPGLRQHNRW